MTVDSATLHAALLAELDKPHEIWAPPNAAVKTIAQTLGVETPAN